MAEIAFDQKNLINEEVEYESSISIQGIIVFLLAVFFGLVTAAYILPRWLPGLASTFTGSNPKAGSWLWACCGDR